MEPDYEAPEIFDLGKAQDVILANVLGNACDCNGRKQTAAVFDVDEDG